MEKNLYGNGEKHGTFKEIEIQKENRNEKRTTHYEER